MPTYCSHCNWPKPDDEFKQCEKCRAMAAVRLQKWREERGDDNTVCSSCRRSKPDDRWKQCPKCRESTRLAMAAWRSAKPDGNAKYQRDYHRRRREQVIAHYGGKCACCGETTFEFLAIDHTDGGGMAHRRASGVSSGNGMAGWLLRHGLPPEGFRVLCHNCNMALGFWGYCPHGLLAIEE